MTGASDTLARLTPADEALAVGQLPCAGAAARQCDPPIARMHAVADRAARHRGATRAVAARHRFVPRPCVGMRSIATRQLISPCRPTGRHQFNGSHSRRDSGVRLTWRLCSIVRAITCSSAGLNSRPQYRFMYCRSPRHRWRRAWPPIAAHPFARARSEPSHRARDHGFGRRPANTTSASGAGSAPTTWACSTGSSSWRPAATTIDPDSRVQWIQRSPRIGQAGSHQQLGLAMRVARRRRLS